jgi:hypothetical protein
MQGIEEHLIRCIFYVFLLYRNEVTQVEKEYVVKLDVYLGVLEARVISFNQFNTGTCKLSFELTSNKQALDLTGKKVTFEVTTPSGATLEDAILVTDATQGKCECTLANDMIAEQGLHCGEINVYSADHGKMLTFKKFMYLVNGQLGAKDITVDTRYSTLQELIFDVENLKNQSVIDTEAVAQMKNETDLMHKEVIVKHGDVEVKHQEVVTLAQSVKDDASRTGSNAQQVSTDKGIVTKAKNEVVAKHDEVLKTAGVIAQDKVIVEQAKTEIVGYKNDVEAMKNDVQQLVTDSTEDLILEGNRQVVRVSTEGTTQVDLAKAEVTKATQQATVATEQATIATAKSEEATTQADRATREADRAGAQAQEKVNNKIGLNGVHDDTIFNFIENQVVQDGLIDSIGISRGLWTNKFTSMDGCSITNNELVCDNTKTTTSVLEYRELKAISFTFSISNFDNGDGCGGQILSYESNGFKTSIGYNKAGTMQVYFNNVIYNGSMLYLNKTHNITVTSSYEIFLDGEKVYLNDYLNSIKYFPAYTTNKIRIGSNEYKGEFKGIVKALDMYNHTLTPQEIQHNLSVLNNSPSIKELHTTDSTGKTSILKLGSNSHHTEMASGRTLEEEYTSLLGRFGKEFDSINGSTIEVNNGISGKVLKMSIKGQTVKNIANVVKGREYTIAGTTPIQLGTQVGFEANKQYTIAFNARVTSESKIVFAFDGAWYGTYVPSGGVTVKDGLNIFKISQPNLFAGKYEIIAKGVSSNTNVTISDFCIIDGDVAPTSYVPFGLSSTEAIISNNGMEYPFYEPTIQGKTRILDADTGLVPTDPTLPALKDGDVLDLATRTITFANKTTRVLTDEEVKAYSAFKKVISLRGTSETKDTLEIKEDGIGVWTRNLVTQAIKYSDNWQTYDKYADGYKTYKVKQKEQIMNVNSICICDKLPHQKWITAIYPTPALAGEYITVHGDAFVISVKEETAPTLDDFKNYLKQIGDIIITYPTKTPTTTPIPKELVPTILTQQTNILEVGGAVKPSSFKVTLPVDRIAELTARLEAVEAKTNTQPVNTAFVDETYAKSVNKIEEVIK